MARSMTVWWMGVWWNLLDHNQKWTRGVATRLAVFSIGLVDLSILMCGVTNDTLLPGNIGQTCCQEEIRYVQSMERSDTHNKHKCIRQQQQQQQYSDFLPMRRQANWYAFVSQRGKLVAYILLEAAEFSMVSSSTVLDPLAWMVVEMVFLVPFLKFLPGWYRVECW